MTKKWENPDIHIIIYMNITSKSIEVVTERPSGKRTDFYIEFIRAIDRNFMDFLGSENFSRILRKYMSLISTNNIQATTIAKLVIYLMYLLRNERLINIISDTRTILENGRSRSVQTYYVMMSKMSKKIREALA